MLSASKQLVAGMTVAAATTTLHGDFVEFTDKASWIETVGVFSTIDFTGFPNDTFITDQYASLGVLFTDGDDNIVCCGGDSFPNDLAGLDGNARINLLFLTPQNWIAADYPGALRFELFYQDELIYTSSDFGFSGPGHFAGLVSSQPFDRAVLIDWFDEIQVGLDDLHFGAPAPGTLALLALFGLCPHRRRRTTGIR